MYQNCLPRSLGICDCKSWRRCSADRTHRKPAWVHKVGKYLTGPKLDIWGLRFCSVVSKVTSRSNLAIKMSHFWEGLIKITYPKSNELDWNAKSSSFAMWKFKITASAQLCMTAQFQSLKIKSLHDRCHSARRLYTCALKKNCIFERDLLIWSTQVSHSIFFVRAQLCDGKMHLSPQWTFSG